LFYVEQSSEDEEDDEEPEGGAVIEERSKDKGDEGSTLGARGSELRL
jgi:hypothetical protein